MSQLTHDAADEDIDNVCENQTEEHERQPTELNNDKEIVNTIMNFPGRLYVTSRSNTSRGMDVWTRVTTFSFSSS